MAASALPRAWPTAGIEYVNVVCSLHMVATGQGFCTISIMPEMLCSRAGFFSMLAVLHRMLVLDTCMPFIERSGWHA